MKKLLYIILSILLILNLVGCKKGTATNVVESKDQVVYGVASLPSSLWPVSNSNIREDDLVCSLFEGLVEENELGVIMPAIANEWKVSSDGIEYSFILKEDAKWSDGTAIKAEDFVQYFKALLTGKNKFEFVEELFLIYGAKNYYEGKTSFEGNVAIVAKDEHTLNIRMNAKSDKFLNLLAKPRYRIRQMSDNLKNLEVSYNNIKYSGPYVISNFKSGDYIDLSRNVNMVLGSEAGIDKLQFKLVQGEEVAFAAFNTKNLDLLVDPPIVTLDKDKIINYLQVFPTNNLTALTFNLQDKLMQNDSFRLAIWKALMWEVYDADVVKNNLEEVALGEFVRSDNLGGEAIVNSNLTDNSQEKEAKKREANIILEGFNIVDRTFTMVALNNDLNKRLTSFIQKSLKSNNKLSVKIKLYNETELKEILTEGKYDFYLNNYNIDKQKLPEFFELWNDKGVGKGFKDKDYNDALMRLQGNANKEEEKKAIDKAEMILKLRMPFIPLYFNNMLWCKANTIDKIYINGEGNVIFKNMKLVK